MTWQGRYVQDGKIKDLMSLTIWYIVSYNMIKCNNNLSHTISLSSDKYTILETARSAEPLLFAFCNGAHVCDPVAIRHYHINLEFFVRELDKWLACYFNLLLFV